MNSIEETNFSIYEKCGEILTSFIIDKRLFALKCIFCTDVCENFADFVEHIEERHSSLLTTKQEDELPKTDVNNFNENNIPILVELKEEELDDEASTNVEDVVDPFSSDLKTIEDSDDEIPKEKCSLADESTVKMETDDEGKDVDFENSSSNEDSGENETDDEVNETVHKKNYYIEAEIDTNQALSLALIEGLEKLPVLWKKNDIQPNIRKKREEALRKLSQELNKKFNKKITWTGIQERIKKLRLRYRNELIREQKAILNGEKHKPTWYFPKLHFLRDNIKLTKANLNAIDDKTTEKAIEIQFTDEQYIQFIEFYENYPCLWNIEHTSFKSKNEREKAIEQISALIEEKMQIKLTDDEIQKRLHRIRVTCTKEKHEQLKCERLGTTYKPTFKYYSKIGFLLENVCPFICPYCKETFKGKEPFRVHKAKHTGTSPFTCTICKKGFSSPGNLAIHLRRHNRDYVVECKPCGRKFTTTDEYKIHMRHHTGEKPYFCEVCGKSFATGSLFGRHKRRHDKRPSHFCKICDRGFYEQIRFKEHMNIHNNVRDRVCNVCGKGFTHLKYLKQHVLIHSGRKDYVCKICGKEFAQSAGLYWHMKTHGAKVSDKVPDDKQNTKRAKINLTSM